MIKIWNKIDKINGVDPDYVLKSHNFSLNDEIFLVINDISGRVEEIQEKLRISSIYNLDANMTVEEVAKEYLRIKEEEKNKANEEIITLDNLKKSNANLLKDSASKAIKISNLNKSLSTVTLELAKLKAQK